MKTRRERLRLWLKPAVALSSNPVTLAGAILTTSAAVTIVGLWLFEALSSRPVSAYTGIISFLILPALFALGLAVMPIGALWRRRRLRADGRPIPLVPRISFSDPTFRRAVTLVAVATTINVLILATASYRGLEHMDSIQFCGQTCHTVMEPEYTAYRDSPHARVACVDCHIGPGAPWFVRSKLSGTRQIFAVAFKTYSRPIPSPVKHLRPARETCEQCHWPAKFHGDKLLVRTKFAEDERNTPSTTVLVLKIGGRTWQGLTGIHGRHIDTDGRITYVALDEKRQSIPIVEYIDDDGREVEYVSEETQATREQIARSERRKMDCIDCHNRPTHIFELPERALDRALDEGRIDRQLPFVKKQAMELLKADYADRDSAERSIEERLTAFYREYYPDIQSRKRAQIQAAASQLRSIWANNVYPKMKVTWGTYPNHIGHEDFPGCFRCHDDSHKAADGRVITQDCDACHAILAMDESDPKILSELGFR
jgi:nitrate/TMAO reductase-like tetraheme cytochrome c subunit